MGPKLSTSTKEKQEPYIQIPPDHQANNLTVRFMLHFRARSPEASLRTVKTSILRAHQSVRVGDSITAKASTQLFHQVEVKFIADVTWHERKAESLHTHGSQLSPIETATRTKSNKLQQYHCMFVPETSRSTVIGSIRHTNRQEQKAGRQLLHKGMGG